MENKNKKICKFCDTEVENLNDNYVCHKCKAVIFSGKYTCSEIKEKISEYIADVEKSLKEMLAKQNGALSVIKPESEMSEKKMEMQNNLRKYNGVKLDLSICLNDGANFGSKFFRQKLYNMAMLAPWIKENILNR